MSERTAFHTIRRKHQMATAPLDRAGVLPSQLTDGMGILIDGEWREASETFTTTAPATGSDLLKVANANSSDVSRAVQSAVNASEQWRAARAVQRLQADHRTRV